MTTANFTPQTIERSSPFGTGKAFIALASLLTAGMILPASANSSHRPIRCDDVKQAHILAADGTFLGSLEDGHARDSIMNKDGPYGSRLALNSLWNPASPYGSATSRKSPMNRIDGMPAQVVKNGKVVGKVMRGSLRSWIEDPAKLVQRCYNFTP